MIQSIGGMIVNVVDPLSEVLRKCKGCSLGMRIANIPLFDKATIEEVGADFIVISSPTIKKQLVPMQHIISINADDIPQEKPEHGE